MSPSCASRTYFLFLLCVILLQDKANKRRMLMAIDCRKKLLKNLRLVRYDAFEKVCEQLGITYTFPPQYYRRATRRWLAKKAFCLKVASTSTMVFFTAYFISFNLSFYICSRIIPVKIKPFFKLLFQTKRSCSARGVREKCFPFVNV